MEQRRNPGPGDIGLGRDDRHGDLRHALRHVRMHDNRPGTRLGQGRCVFPVVQEADIAWFGRLKRGDAAQHQPARRRIGLRGVRHGGQAMRTGPAEEAGVSRDRRPVQASAPRARLSGAVASPAAATSRAASPPRPAPAHPAHPAPSEAVGQRPAPERPVPPAVGQGRAAPRPTAWPRQPEAATSLARRRRAVSAPRSVPCSGRPRPAASGRNHWLSREFARGSAQC